MAILLGLNAFFVLAEFALVKTRPSRITELVAAGHPGALALKKVHGALDEYLSVCQVGITFASVALGMVGQTAADIILGDPGASSMRVVAASLVSYVLVSGSHILLGELVPKSAAIRLADKASLWVAAPLRIFYLGFYPILWLLTHMANAILRLLRIGPVGYDESHTEGELRIILERSQEHGMMSFRRLLFMENVFDFGELTVKDAMRGRGAVRCLDARQPWAHNLHVIRGSQFTRYPLLTDDAALPQGFIHLKDLVMRDEAQDPPLAAMARPLLTTSLHASLENLLARMQRRRIHAALVLDDDAEWVGLITLEDVIEELVGTIRDEFEEEEPIRLADVLRPEQIHLEIEANSPEEAVRQALAQTPSTSVPMPAPEILDAIRARERLVGTYLGRGIGLPHARLAGLQRPFVMVVRSKLGISCSGTTEKAHLLFVLLTPAQQPRVHQKLQSIIATLLHESEYVRDRLLQGTTPDEIYEALRTGEQTSLD